MRLGSSPQRADTSASTNCPGTFGSAAGLVVFAAVHWAGSPRSNWLSSHSCSRLVWEGERAEGTFEASIPRQ